MLVSCLQAHLFHFVRWLYITDKTQVALATNSLDKRCVVKFATHDRFLRERTMLGHLKTNKHIISVQQSLESPNFPLCGGLVFKEYCLSSFIPRDDTERLSFMYQLLQALDSCCSAGVVHRDVKPANILYSRRFKLEIVLADFDHAVYYPEGNIRECVGTVPYIAPEMLHPMVGYYDFASDVWSAGVVFCELFGIHLFAEAKSTSELIKLIEDFYERREHFLQPQCGQQLWSKALPLLEHMLEVNIDKRWGARDCLSHELFASFK